MNTKNPAFLFYSKDFYEGTRMMLPEERACLIDLLIYQHQNRIIPLNLKRVLMYCSGINEATLKATLEAKFERTEKGYLNTRLDAILSERKKYQNKQAVSGTIGQFWKKCKAFLSEEDYTNTRQSLINTDTYLIFEFIKNKKITQSNLKGLLKGLLKHIGDGDGDGDGIINKDEIINLKKLSKSKKIDFKSQALNSKWAEWKSYKALNFAFEYKTDKTENAAKQKLLKLAKDNEEAAIKILQKAIDNNWQGFFALNNDNNHNSAEDGNR